MQAKNPRVGTVVVPAIASPSADADGPVIYPPIVTERIDTAERVRAFAELWRWLQAQRCFTQEQVYRFESHSMLLKPKSTPKPTQRRGG